MYLSLNAFISLVDFIARQRWRNNIQTASRCCIHHLQQREAAWIKLTTKIYWSWLKLLLSIDLLCLMVIVVNLQPKLLLCCRVCYFQLYDSQWYHLRLMNYRISPIAIPLNAPNSWNSRQCWISQSYFTNAIWCTEYIIRNRKSLVSSHNF